MPTHQRDPPASRYAYEGLSRIIHERARLSMLTSLATHSNGVSFVDLKRLCGLTDGNLSRHLQILQSAGLIEIDKAFEGSRSRTLCRLTRLGRERYVEYLAVLETVVRDAAKAVQRRSWLSSKDSSKGR